LILAPLVLVAVIGLACTGPKPTTSLSATPTSTVDLPAPVYPRPTPSIGATVVPTQIPTETPPTWSDQHPCHPTR